MKLALQRQGRRKLSQIAKREIIALANEYLAAHPELIAEAKETALRWAAEGFFGKKAALSVQHSQDSHNARRPEPQGLQHKSLGMTMAGAKMRVRVIRLRSNIRELCGKSISQ